MKDIYFDPNYGKLYESVEKGECIFWSYTGSEGKVTHQFILREIPIETKEKWYDIVTPYGYGGPVIEYVSPGYTFGDLGEAFENAFSAFCKENKVVSEFVRFHPLYNNALDFAKSYEATAIRKTLGTNLKDYEDPVKEEFSKGCRKKIRRALNAGVGYRVVESPNQMDEFIHIYYDTMRRDNADEFYYFARGYFDELLAVFKDRIIMVEAIYEDKVIAANICFVSDGNIHVHLSGTLEEFLDLSPAYILKYATVIWGKEHGLNMVHYGGGTSNARDNSLFEFKKRFAQNTEFDFYIGKRIWNESIYNALCEEKGITDHGDFFPAYRKK